MTNYRGTVNGLIGGTLPWSFRMHMAASLTEGQVSTNFSTSIGTLFTTATNGLENFMSADVTVTGTLVSTLSPQMKQTTGTRASLTITGTDASASLPWQTAEVVTWRTTMLQKRGHGRIFLPPFAEDQVTAHVIKSATVTSMITVFNAFFTSMTGAGISFFIYNARTLKDGTAPFSTLVVTGYDVSNKPAVQRRRVSKVVPTRSTGTV